MLDLEQWAKRWGVQHAAIVELAQMARACADTYDVPEPKRGDDSEAAVMSECRIYSNNYGRLWRNNNGALKDANGRLVRYGIANDTKEMNKSFKSSDLIGLRPILIGPEHVGRVIGQFWAVETKERGWLWRGTPEEKAQLAFGLFVRSMGGRFTFANGVRDLKNDRS